MKKFHTQYSDGRPKAVVDCQEAAKHRTDDLGAKQSFKDECDINRIVERFAKTGQLPGSGAQAQYLDLAVMPQDFLSALEIVERAEDAFLSLPAAVRAECHNRPDLFLGKLQDAEWAKKHGLLAPAPSEASPEPAQAPEAPPAPRTASPAAPSSASPGPSESTKG